MRSFVKKRTTARLNAWGLDANDTIVRRRLVQKLTFLTEDLSTAQEPTAAELEAYFDQHTQRYALPRRVTFRHRYFSTDRRQTAEQDARAALTDESAAGDPFMLQRAYAERNERDVANLFGQTFAAEIFALEPGAWRGPVRSAFGWHAVWVERFSPATARPLEQVRSRVLADLQMQRRQDANTRYAQDLLERYEVVRP